MKYISDYFIRLILLLYQKSKTVTKNMICKRKKMRNWISSTLKTLALGTTVTEDEKIN
jgi:hypothetical protein